MYKKVFLAISLLLSSSVLLEAIQRHSQQQSHVVTTTQGVSVSSELITILQDIASLLSSSANASALTTILQQLNIGITLFEVQIFEQALQEALQILVSSGGKLNGFTVIEYTGILIETIAQLEAAHAQVSSAATSTVITSTVR